MNKEILEYINNKGETLPLLVNGDASDVLKNFPNECIDCIVTSPPYWGMRQYESGGIGLEKDYNEYISNLMVIVKELQRILKRGGAFWLNIGDSYKEKQLLGIPWRIALKMIDDGWILRNDIIWYKHKGGMCSSKDRFGAVFEDFFFFVKETDYYFDADSIRSNPRTTIVKNGAVISSTGVSGVRYKRQIEMSTSLTENEKVNAINDLNTVLGKIQNGEISDFRMVIRNQQRTTHSDSTTVSGRAKELRDKGYYFLFYNPNGTMPSNVWDILPEDTQNRSSHFAPYPEELCVMPIKCTCPLNGIVLDPFSGTGTTMKVAYELGRKSIGIDISEEYNKQARNRITPRLAI